MLQIGITARASDNIFSNGMDQNIYYLHLMLEDMGYEPTLISEAENVGKLVGVQIHPADIYSIMKFDIILEVAHPLSDNLVKSFNSSGKPLIGVKYGNNFMLDLECYVSKDREKQNSSTGINLPFRNREIWVSEQFWKFKDYIEILTRCKVRIMPYIWDSSILRMHDDGFHKEDMRLSSEDFRRIAIVEPNINILKNCMIPLAICEMAHNKRSDLVKEVYCFGSKIFEKNLVFKSYIDMLNIHHNKVCSYEGRYPICKIFGKNIANTIVSTQLFNEQNYVYLETLFYKRLLIHNSPLFEDVGHYYPELDVNTGSDKLIDAIESFDQIKHRESYEEKLDGVSIYNDKNREAMRTLIENLF